ncbi:hypothetical protein L6452_09728 [Arctium lappa]|uniref:Uncharacterized protein n=1 Tax=Arctium lappa TaxID=4217 RepID=A0ACB9DKV8_ARCLA|nr:hypothetical protein L6452_09728 [Arctium lappa]
MYPCVCLCLCLCQYVLASEMNRRKDGDGVTMGLDGDGGYDRFESDIDQRFHPQLRFIAICMGICSSSIDIAVERDFGRKEVGYDLEMGGDEDASRDLHFPWSVTDAKDGD